MPGERAHLQVISATTNQSLDALATVTVVRLSEPFDSVTGSAIRQTGSRYPVALISEVGPYRIRVVVAGYQPFEQEVNVTTVGGGTCSGVTTLQVVARLMPQ